MWMVPSLRLGGDGAKAGAVHAVGDLDAALRGTAQLDLDPPRAAVEAGDHRGPLVGAGREHVEEPNPVLLEGRQHPLGPDDLLLPLPGVDPVLREQVGHMVAVAAQPGQNAAVPGGDGVVHVRLRDLRVEDVQHRQEHGAHRVEEVGKRRVAVLLPADPGEDVQKRLAHEKGEGGDALVGVHAKQGLPVRPGAVDEIVQRLQLLSREAVLLAPGGQLQGVLQEDLMDLHHILRQGVFELTLHGGVRPHGPEHKFMLGHGLDILMDPGRDTAGDVGIAPLQNDADPHGSCLPSQCTSISLCSQESR